MSTNEVGRDMLDKIAHAPQKLLVSLRVSFLTVTVLTVLISALSTHIPWVLISNANVQDMANQISEEIVKGVGREVSDMFSSAYSDQRAITDILSTKTIGLDDVAKREALFMSFIKSNRFYSFVAVGLENGNFYGAQRKDEANILTINSIYNADSKKAARTERQYVGAGRDFSYVRESTKTNDYSSTDRSWYKLAKNNPTLDVLTEPYIFANTGKPGVNTATTLEVDGKIVGVVNIAIELGRISAYMRDLKVGKTGTAFLVSPMGELLAFKETYDSNLIVRETRTAPGEAKTATLTIPKIGEIQHPLLKIATAAIAREKLDLDNIRSANHLFFAGADASKESFFVTLAPTGRNDWVVGTVVPRSDFTAQIEANLRLIWMLVIGVILLACGLAAWVSQKLFVKPLRVIIDQTQQVKRFELAAVEGVDTNISEIHNLSTSINQMSQGLENFGRFIPLDLVKTLLSQGVRADISGENRTLTIFFMDMVGFTTISEEMGPKLVPYLGKYLSCMSNVIDKHHGTIDKYIGDAVMAFWGAPLYNEDHAVACCRAAVECLVELEELRKEWPEKFRAGLGIRMGLNTGRVIVGNIGSSSRLNYTVLGDPVNLAARLESAGKDYGVSCMIGQSTYELARYDIVARKLDVLRVKGKTEAVPVYELLAMADTPATEDYGWIKVFEEGVAYFLDGNFEMARQRFERTIEMRGKDLPSEKFIYRCDQSGVLEV
jgi:adenylate cyclase